MNNKQLVEIVLKLFGVYLIFLAFENLTGLIDSLSWLTDSRSENKILFLGRLTRVVVYLIGSRFFILKPDIIINKLNIQGLEKTGNLNIQSTQLQKMLFQTAGIIILFFSINDIISAIFLTSIADPDGMGPHAYKLYFFYLTPPLLKITLGFSLLFFPSFLSKLISKKDKKSLTNKD
ncbi:MAG: hypothetical protein MK078_15450 [Crocinitomicaceae bacterium]|nr:hypothetical protein [Crocinitomicaceae bacterium]